MELTVHQPVELASLAEAATKRWPGKVEAEIDPEQPLCQMACDTGEIQDVCHWLFAKLNYSFASLVVEETPAAWVLRYIFYGDADAGQVHLLVRLAKPETTLPSISTRVHAADWHEREVEDLFGLVFEDHPRLGDFVLHNDEWQEDVNPMRKDFDASKPYPHREPDPDWRPLRVVQAPGSFLMPIGPIYSDVEESAHFLLETVGEDVIRTITRFFYKYRGVEKIAEGRSVEDALLLAERFSGTSAFAHSLAFCQAAETIAGVPVPARARALRIMLAELERFRHHVGVIQKICGSTGLAVATSQAAILEEELLRLSCQLTGHRYLFGLNLPGGLSRDFPDEACGKVAETVRALVERLSELREMLRYSGSFLDRLEEVGIISHQDAIAFGLVGPIARASGIARDLRRAQPYGGYERVDFSAPCEQEGDGYARLRVFFTEAEQSVRIIEQVVATLPGGSVRASSWAPTAGAALGWVEAPRGAAFHWLRIAEDGLVARYRLATPSFTNWHGFHLAAEDFAFQDFPIIMASFGLSIAECDR